VKPKD